MANLVILGNTNQHTFANAIIAANSKAKVLFDRPLRNIYVIHSKQSDDALRRSREWVTHLLTVNIDAYIIISRVMELTSTPGSVEQFVEYLETIVKGSDDSSKFIIDLSNGTTFHRTMLSTAAYVLNMPNQYLIDVSILRSNLKETVVMGFLEESILDSSYTKAPDTTEFDRIAYLNLTEIVRYKNIISEHTSKYANMATGSADKRFFGDNLMHSISLKLLGDRTKDNAVYRIAASSVGAGLDELVSLLLDGINRKLAISRDSKSTFGPKLESIFSKVQRCASPDFDLKFLSLLNQFVLHLRNSTTHKGPLLTDVEKFKAELSVKMAFPFIEFYTDIIYPLLLKDGNVEKPRQIKRLSSTQGGKFYGGLDGDNTGAILEDLFIESSDEKKFRNTSKSIKDAIDDLAFYITANWGNGSVIFATGDDLLFKAAFNVADLQAMQKQYFDKTGLTCSIGYGKSFHEVYIALKLAKTEPGKSSIVGVELV